MMAQVRKKNEDFHHSMVFFHHSPNSWWLLTQLHFDQKTGSDVVIIPFWHGFKKERKMPIFILANSKKITKAGAEGTKRPNLCKLLPIKNNLKVYVKIQLKSIT